MVKRRHPLTIALAVWLKQEESGVKINISKISNRLPARALPHNTICQKYNQLDRPGDEEIGTLLLTILLKSIWTGRSGISKGCKRWEYASQRVNPILVG